MNSFESRWKTKIQLIDDALNAPANLSGLEKLKETFEAQSLPVWFLHVNHDDYATLFYVNGPLNIREMNSREVDERSVGSQRPYCLDGQLAAFEQYQFCYPNSSQEGVFSVWPSQLKPGALSLARIIQSKKSYNNESYVIGEEKLVQQFGVWKVEDPRVKNLSDEEVGIWAGRLFVNRYEPLSGGIAHLRNKFSFIAYAKERGLVGKDIICCMERLYKDHGAELE